MTYNLLLWLYELVTVLAVEFLRPLEIAIRYLTWTVGLEIAFSLLRYARVDDTWTHFRVDERSNHRTEYL